MTTDKTIRKVYDLQEARLDRRGPRVAVRPPAVADLAGVDGQSEGVVRPFPGFVAIHEFDWEEWDAAVETAVGTPALYHDKSSTIVDVFVRDFLVGERDYGYAIFYRVRRAQDETGATACDIFVDQWKSVFGGQWTRSILLKAGVPLPYRLDQVDGKQMDVVVFGHLMYVLVEGDDPILFYNGKDSPYGANTVVGPGPGPQVLLKSPEDVASLGSITAPVGTETALGQVALLQYLPYETGLFDDWEYGPGTGTGTGSGDPDEAEIKWLEPGDYSFAIEMVDSTTGRRSGLSQIAMARVADFEVGSGGGATAYTDLYAVLEVLYDEERWDQVYVYRSVKLQDAGGTLVGNVLKLDGIVELADFQTVNNPGSVTSGYAQSVYWYVLEDKQLSLQYEYQDFKTFDDYVPKGGSGIMYDGTMVVGKIRSTGEASSQSVRVNDLYRGATEIRWSGTLELSPEMFPPGNRFVPSLPANEVITFVRLGPNILGFSRDRQYLGRKEGGYLKFHEMLEGFGVVSQRAAEPVGSLVYFATSKGLKSVSPDGQMEDLSALNYVFVEDWKESLEEVSLAFDSNLSALFVMNREEQEAYVLWFNTARVTRLADMGFEMVVRGSWPRGFVFDRDNLVNSNGADNATYRNPLEERAIFVENAPKGDADEIVDHFQFRLYAVDTLRAKRRTGATSGTATDVRYSMMPFEGDAVFQVQTDFESNADNRLRLVTTGRTLEDLWGGWLYVLEAADTSLVGTKARLKKSNSPHAGSVYLQEDPTHWDGLLVAGDVVGYSPVFVEVVGHPLNVEDEGYVSASPADFFRQRHVQTISLAMTGVRGQSLEESLGAVARFQGVLYEGVDEDPVEVAETLDQTGDPAASVREGESLHGASFGAQPAGSTLAGRFGRSGPILSPGFRLFCPDLDFRVLAMKVVGNMRAGDASSVVTR